RAARLLPERDLLAPVVGRALARRRPDLEADIFRLAARGFDHPAQPIEDLQHLVARRPAVGHEAVAVLGDARQRLLGMAAEPDRDLAGLGPRVDAAVGQLVILALEGDAGLGPQRLHEPDLLGRPDAAGVEIHAEALELE